MHHNQQKIGRIDVLPPSNSLKMHPQNNVSHRMDPSMQKRLLVTKDRKISEDLRASISSNGSSRSLTLNLNNSNHSNRSLGSHGSNPLLEKRHSGNYVPRYSDTSSENRPYQEVRFSDLDHIIFIPRDPNYPLRKNFHSVEKGEFPEELRNAQEDREKKLHHLDALFGSMRTSQRQLIENQKIQETLKQDKNNKGSFFGKFLSKKPQHIPQSQQAEQQQQEQQPQKMHLHSRDRMNEAQQQQQQPQPQQQRRQQKLPPTIPAVHSRDHINELHSPSQRQYLPAIRDHSHDPRYRRKDTLTESLLEHQTRNTTKTHPRRTKSDTNMARRARPQVPRQASEPSQRLRRSAAPSHQTGSKRRNPS